MEQVLIVIVSFFCSVGFGVVFGIAARELPLAGLGGMLTRIVSLWATAWIPSRFLATLAASLANALYAQLLARRMRVPITKFLYPSLVPIIPGDMLYNTAVCLMASSAEVLDYGALLLQSMLGLAIGPMAMPVFFRAVGTLKGRNKTHA